MSYIHPVHPTKAQDDQVDLSVRDRKLRSRTLKLADGVTELPDRIVYKLSYQTEGHTSEGPLFSRFLGQFGIIDMVGFHTCGQDEPFGNTEYLIQNASFWDFSQSQGKTGVPIPIPEKRYLQCTAMSFECLPLLDTLDKETGIPTPTELLETILHAMIGEYFILHIYSISCCQVTITCFLMVSCTETSVTEISSASGSRSNALEVSPRMCGSYILFLFVLSCVNATTGLDPCSDST